MPTPYMGGARDVVAPRHGGRPILWVVALVAAVTAFALASTSGGTTALDAPAMTSAVQPLASDTDAWTEAAIGEERVQVSAPPPASVRASFVSEPLDTLRTLEATRPRPPSAAAPSPARTTLTPALSQKESRPETTGAIATSPVAPTAGESSSPTAPAVEATSVAPAPVALPSETPAPSTVASTPADSASVPIAPPVAVGLNARGLAFLAAMNAARASQGLSALSVTADLSGVAAARASDMIVNAYFAHVSPTGESWLTMLNARGIQLPSGGENLAQVSGDVDQSVAIAVESLMASPTHRANILNASFTEAGIAALTDAEGTTTFVTIFGSR